MWNRKRARWRKPPYGSSGRADRSWGYITSTDHQIITNGLMGCVFTQRLTPIRDGSAEWKKEYLEANTPRIEVAFAMLRRYWDQQTPDWGQLECPLSPRLLFDKLWGDTDVGGWSSWQLYFRGLGMWLVGRWPSSTRDGWTEERVPLIWQSPHRSRLLSVYYAIGVLRMRKWTRNIHICTCLLILQRWSNTSVNYRFYRMS